MKKNSYFSEGNKVPLRKIKFHNRFTNQIEEISFSDFYEKTKITFLTSLLFYNEKTFLKVKELIKKKVQQNKISHRAKIVGKKFSEKIEEGYVEDVYIKRINNHKGFGLFAHCDFSQGIFIGEYVGLIRPCTIFFANVNEYCFRYPLYKIGWKIYTIDAEKFCNETSFMNHSDHPNCESIVALHGDLLHVCIFTKEAIKKDEELTYDYGNDLWRLR